jgi:hypothetical protein
MARSSLFNAAERLDRIVQDVKERQFGATGVHLMPVEAPPVLHPEEAWARRFASHSIRPNRAEGARPPLSSFVAPPADMPQKPVFEMPAAKLDGRAGTGHIGSMFGKPGPRRSWVGRLFRGRGI